jgi:SnoaL-like domain
MPPDNVDVVRRYLEGTDAPGGEGSPWDASEEAIRAWFDEFWEPNGDYYPVAKFPEARPCHGLDEIVGFFKQYLGTWERYRVVVKEARAIGEDRVLAHGHLHAEGSGSGVALEGDVYNCCWLRNGRLIRVEDHLTKANALHAIGV